MWTVGELREWLDNYGDHVKVVVQWDRGEHTFTQDEFDVDDATVDGEGVLAIIIDTEE